MTQIISKAKIIASTQLALTFLPPPDFSIDDCDMFLPQPE
jgi:hypothetical protein